jgi:stalled ribosome rescue protein Dom34
MKKNVGIWIDTKQAFIIKLSDNNEHSIKKIGSNIETRERDEGESSKYGRFGNQYLTFEKNRMNRKNEQTNQYMKSLIKEVHNCDKIVVFGPSNMKKIFEKEVKKNMQMAEKLVGVSNAELLTDNQMVAWVKDYFK